MNGWVADGAKVPVFKTDYVIGMIQGVPAVRHEKYTPSPIPIIGENPIHLGSRLLIQIPGRLIGQKDRWLEQCCPGNGSPLTLARAQLGRLVICAICQTESIDQRD